ncbi:MAG: trimeric intracellular cation channel family protein [Rhodospirillaceae bacterium]
MSAPLEDAAQLLYVFTLLGVAVFACSGALAAGRRNFDPIGVAVLAMVTATGGGTLRDVLLDRTVFWISDATHILVCLGTAAATWIWVRFFAPPDRALLLADAMGLALFAVIGAQIAEGLGSGPTIVILMGVITGCAGGLLRDVLTAEVPLLFRKSELYVTTCVVGLALYVLLRRLGADADLAGGFGSATILALRLASIRWKIMLPTMRVGKDRTDC